MNIDLNKIKKMYYFFRNPVYMVYCFIFRPKSQGVKIIVESEGKFLMVKINYAHKNWTFPGRGVKKNETFLNAANRELEEETGIKSGNLIEIGQYSSERYYRRNIVKCYYLKSNNQDVKVDNFEVGEFGWFFPNNLPENQSFAVQNIIEVLNKFKNNEHQFGKN